MAKRKIPKEADLKRKAPVRDPLRLIYIICEGETERDYFEKLKELKSAILTVDVQSQGGAIYELVSKVLKKEKELKEYAAKTKNSFDKLYSVWAVPDVDEHPRLKEAKKLAYQNNLNFALSNPCFEIWGIYHFEEFEKPVNRFEAQRHLKTLMDNYCHKANPYFDKSVILKDYDKAIINAEKAFHNRIAQHDTHGTPSTAVYELVHLIINGITKSQANIIAEEKRKKEETDKVKKISESYVE